MNTGWESVPPGQVWVPVQDMPSALKALEVLTDHTLHFGAEVEPPDCDEV